MTVTEKRIASVEWLRIFAAMCVAMFHFEALYFGKNVYFANIAVVVDFFFILSGFLLMKGILAKEPPGTGSSLTASLQFVFRKAKSFYLPYILAFAMTFILTTVAAKMTNPGEIVARLFHFKWEALLLQMAGFNPSPAFNADYLAGSAWFLSAMLIAMLPVHYFASRHRHAYISLIAPVSTLSVYCFIMQNYGTMNVGNELVGFVMLGTLRAFAGLGLGCMCFAIYDKIRDLQWTQRSTVGLGIVEAICFLSLPCLILLRDSISSPDTLFWVLIFAILVIFCFSEKTPLVRILNRHGANAASYLGRLSLYIYLFHWFFVLLFVNYAPELSYCSGQLSYCLCVISASMLVMHLIDRQKNWQIIRATKQG